MSKTAIILLVLIVCVAGALVLFNRAPDLEESRTQAQRISVSGYDQTGVLAWSVQAERGSLDANDGVLEDVTLSLVGDPNAPVILDADRLSRNATGSQLTGSIHVQQGDVLTLDTDLLFWDERNHVLEASLVDIEMESTTIRAGAFHHNLETGQTTLSQGIRAQILHNQTMYEAQSDDAEADSRQIALIGNVVIVAENGDRFACERAESAQSTIRLMGHVVGEWQGNEFSAATVLMDEEGIRLHENVTIDLDLLMMEPTHDS